MIDVQINFEKPERDVNDLASRSQAEGFLGDHHSILMTPTSILTVNYGGITLCKALQAVRFPYFSMHRCSV